MIRRTGWKYIHKILITTHRRTYFLSLEVDLLAIWEAGGGIVEYGKGLSDGIERLLTHDILFVCTTVHYDALRERLYPRAENAPSPSFPLVR
jgi:hypothetical protein